MNIDGARRIRVTPAEFETMHQAARFADLSIAASPRTVTRLATLDAFLDGVGDGLSRGEAQRVGLRGLVIPRELAGEVQAVMAAMSLARERDGIPDPDELERIALDALPPERRAAKRQAMAQRRAREAAE